MKLIDIQKTLETTTEDLVQYLKETKDLIIPPDDNFEISYEDAKDANWKLSHIFFEMRNIPKAEVIVYKICHKGN